MRAQLAEEMGEDQLIEADIISAVRYWREAQEQGKTVVLRRIWWYTACCMHKALITWTMTKPELMEDLERQILARLGFDDPGEQGHRLT